MSKINLTQIMMQKFSLELNSLLAMENSGIERLQSRIEEVSLPDAKQRMQQHIEESIVHQKRLQQLVTSIGGTPTTEKLGLPLPSFPQPMLDMMNNTMTKQEWELKKSEFDLIVERAEVVSYLMTIQKCQMAGGQFLNAVEPLALNMKDEAQMADWIQTNSPGMLAQLWPKIQSAVASASSPTSSQSPTQSQ
ncbi:MAG TPA: ferritin-like domain-containing protein [Nitrososphaeraceae archaeon]